MMVLSCNLAGMKSGVKRIVLNPATLDVYEKSLERRLVQGFVVVIIHLSPQRLPPRLPFSTRWMERGALKHGLEALTLPPILPCIKGGIVAALYTVRLNDKTNQYSCHATMEERKI